VGGRRKVNTEHRSAEEWSARTCLSNLTGGEREGNRLHGLEK